MRLCSFWHEGATRIGVVTESGIVDLAAVAPALPREMTALLAAGEDALHAAANAATRARGRLALEAVRLAAPILRPPKFLAIGLNYADHVAEAGARAAAVPDRLQQAVHLRRGPARSDPHAARLVRARLRGRARLRDRPALPPRAARARARGDRRLPRRERRDRARLAAPRCRPGRWASPSTRTARSVPGSRRADEVGDPHGLRAAHLGERRAAPGLEHEAARSSTASRWSSTSRRRSRSSPATSSRRGRRAASASR